MLLPTRVPVPTFRHLADACEAELSWMESAIRLLRMLRIAMLLSIVTYVFVGERAGPGPKATDPVFASVLSLFAITTVGVILVVRRTLVLQSQKMLEAQPTDATILGRWRAGYIVTYALCEALALYGLVLRLVGSTLSQIAPFYLAGFALMLFFSPRQPSQQLS